MEQKYKKRLTKKERLFCGCYVECGNAEEAARKAGFPKEKETAGAELLCRADITDEIGRLLSRREEVLRYRIQCGYERLVFSNPTDSVKLLFMREPDLRELDALDLFNVAEIRRPKDGMIEIKFYDRLRALEKMAGLQEQKGGEAVPFYKALESGARALENRRKGDSEE